MMLAYQSATRAIEEERSVEHPTLYPTTHVDGLSIFYREAGPKDAPTLLLVRGLPGDECLARGARCGSAWRN
jgi:hypothetical protein